MATAPFLLLIVAAVPRADAVPAFVAPLGASPVATHDAPIAAASVRLVRDVDDEAPTAVRALTVAPRVSRRPMREPLIEALPVPPLDVGTPPALAPRTEPGAARGPPA